MIKRTAGSEDAIRPKRRKIAIALKSTAEPETDRHKIRSSQDLPSLLAFDQDVTVSMQKIQSFKSFLSSVVESDEVSAKRNLLYDYLQSQIDPKGKESTAFLGDIIKTWHFAAQSNADSLFASVTGVLALLLKTISSYFDFREYGNCLCTLVLHDDQVKILDRGLSTHRAKDYHISLCLQLLTEVVVFDGGHAASRLYHQRDITFKRLDAFLGMRRDMKGDNVKPPEMRSVRQSALGYLFANLRLQGAAAKMNIITQGRILHALLDDIAQDPPSVVLEILEVLRREIAMDSEMNPNAKSRFFNQWTLSQLTTLYDYNESDSLPDAHQDTKRSVHDLLLLLCTSPGCGLVDVVRHASNTGSFAFMAEKTIESPSQPDITNNLDDNYRLARRNSRLQQFLQSLRPYAKVPQRDLILAVFQKMPELVPDYFSGGKTFSFDPRLTTTWLGYSSFLLAVIAIPLPDSLTFLSINDTVPPLCDTILKSIIPKPCTQRTMTRCLNQSVNLVKFLTLQILNAAFDKFEKVLQTCEHIQHYTDDQKKKLAWCDLALKLREDFRHHVPELRHVISLFRSCPRKSTMLRESTAHLIAFYFKLMPKVALEEKVDISVSLSTALMELESSDESYEQGGIRLLELEHLLKIAHRSPNVSWWHKPEKMWLSPFTMLLRLLLDRIRVGTKAEQLRTLLNTVATERHILHSTNSRTSLNNLVISVQGIEDRKASDRVLEFLDHCILRLVKQPVHYYDILAKLIAATKLDINPGRCRVDLLVITLTDQWRFLVKNADAPTVTDVSRWLVRYMELINVENGNVEKGPICDETTKLLSKLREQLKSNVQDTTCLVMFEKAFEERPELGTSKQVVAAITTSETGHKLRFTDLPLNKHPKSEIVLPPGPTEEHKDHPGLHQWIRHEIQDAISEGHIKALILCLCSKYAGIRKQALTGVRAFMERLKLSDYSEGQQTYMLVGEIAETAANIIADDPLPYYAGVFAAALFSVLSDPLHLMYAKVNEFLNRGPQWNVTKLPSYWVDKVLMKPPTVDDGYFEEAEWLLDGLIDGLRTSADMNLYRKCHIFERLLSFSASPSLPEPCFQKILDLLFRCTYVEGSSTLITRCGLMSWISSHLRSHATNDMTRERLRMLASRAYETSDDEWIDEWANGTIAYTLKSLG